MVYVLSKDSKPLMPTENHAKVRILLKTKKSRGSQEVSVYNKTSVRQYRIHTGYKPWGRCR